MPKQKRHCIRTQFGTFRATLAVIFIAAALNCVPAVLANTPESTWQPVSSEKLVRLPANFMEKTLERDFRDSPLAGSMAALDEQLRMEGQRMRDFGSAIDTAEGADRVELRHQFLASKADYLELMRDKQQLGRRALETRGRVYEALLVKLRRDRSMAIDPLVADLVQQQEDARARMAATIAEVDTVFLELPYADRSHYTEEFASNLAEIEKLRGAINRHVSNAAPAINGEPVSREDYVRHLLANVETERALLDQEHLMLGYMSRLVALDAQALEQELMAGEELVVGPFREDATRLGNSTDLFID